MKILLVSGIAFSLLTGCGVLAPQKAKILDSRTLANNGELITMPANLRTIDVRKITADGKPEYIVCAEPMPDIAVSNALKLALEASQNASGKSSLVAGADNASAEAAESIGIKGSSEAATTALQLAGRTQVVLLAREFLYRNCVGRANGWLGNVEFNVAQIKIIDQITAMIALETELAKASTAKAEAQTVAVKLVLDKKAIADVAGAVRSEKNKYCMQKYDGCYANAKDEKGVSACRESLTNCNQ